MNLVGHCLLFTLGANVLAVCLWLLVRRFCSLERRLVSNNVSSSYFNTIGTVYAVVLGFMLFDVWGDFQNAARTVEMEAGALAEIARISSGYAPPLRASLQKAVHDYAQAVVDYEWQAMQEGGTSPQAAQAYSKLWQIITSVKPISQWEIIMHGHVIDAAMDLMKHRRLRELKARSSLPPILWIVLWVGGIITVGFSCFFGVEQDHMHLFKIVCLTTMVFIVVFSVWEIYGPFQGSVTVTPDAFHLLLRQLETSAF